MASSWLRQTRKRFLEEQARCQTTISMLSIDKIAKVVEQKMISEHLPEFLAMEGSGIKAIIENDRYEDLALLYQHISRIDPSKEPLRLALQTRVVELGSENQSDHSKHRFRCDRRGGNPKKMESPPPKAPKSRKLAK